MRVLRTVGTVALWMVNILATAAFVAIGFGKFAGPEWPRKFERWGYPDGFYMVIGALEIAGGVILLVPKLSSYAAAVLGVILLLKPFERGRLRKALARAAALAGSAGNPGRLHALVDTVRADRPLQRFLVKTPGRVYAVRAVDVESLEAAGHYVELRTATGSHLVRDSMAALERRLDPARFVRIHRSAIVNVDKVKELRPAFHGEFEVVLWSDRHLRCSRTYAAELTRVMES